MGNYYGVQIVHTVSDPDMWPWVGKYEIGNPILTAYSPLQAILGFFTFRVGEAYLLMEESDWLLHQERRVRFLMEFENCYMPWHDYLFDDV